KDDEAARKGTKQHEGTRSGAFSRTPWTLRQVAALAGCAGVSSSAKPGSGFRDTANGVGNVAVFRGQVATGWRDDLPERGFAGCYNCHKGAEPGAAAERLSCHAITTRSWASAAMLRRTRSR